MADPTALWTEAELRAFDKGQVKSAVDYTTATITAIEAEVREQFAEICGVQFIPTTQTDYYADGTDTATLLLPYVKLISVTSAVIYDSTGVTISETLDATDLTYLAVMPDGRVIRRSGGYWSPAGAKNVKITFKHGHTTVPYAIKRAAMIVAISKLVPSDIYDRATYMSDGAATFGLATAGRSNQWYGIPAVDSVLQQYNCAFEGVG